MWIEDQYMDVVIDMYFSHLLQKFITIHNYVQWCPINIDEFLQKWNVSLISYLCVNANFPLCVNANFICQCQDIMGL